MKSLYLPFLVLVFAVLVSTNVLASSVGGKGDPVDCARLYRNCLNQCNQAEAAAKAVKALCERNAKLAYPNGGALYNAAIKACRDSYTQTMANVAQLRASCKVEYLNCTGGGYEVLPD